MRTDAFETHIRSHGEKGPGGGDVPSPGSCARIRLCAVCRFLYDGDHEEAIVQNGERETGFSVIGEGP